MNIQWAIEQTRLGRRIRREDWGPGASLGFFRFGSGIETPVKNRKDGTQQYISTEDILADDYGGLYDE